MKHFSRVNFWQYFHYIITNSRSKELGTLTVPTFFIFDFIRFSDVIFWTPQNHAGHFLWMAKSLQTQRSIWAGARFPSARQRMCAPKGDLIFSNPLSYHTETSSGQKSIFQAYTTHEAIFQTLAPYFWIKISLENAQPLLKPWKRKSRFAKRFLKVKQIWFHGCGLLLVGYTVAKTHIISLAGNIYKWLWNDLCPWPFF